MSIDCPQTGELERLIRGRITEVRAASLTEHIGLCPECQERMESLAAGGDKHLTTTVRACRLNEAASNSALWPALSAVADEVAATSVYASSDDTDLSERRSGELDLRFLQPASNPQLIGRIGGFDIKRVVGRGGMGVVLQGYDTLLQRDVAIKVLDPQLADNAVARQRFCREARAAAAVTHDNLVAVHQVDELADSELPYLVMQLVVGESLEQRLRRVEKLGPVEVAKIGQQAAAGLAAAHAGGLIHRDIKPGNILLEEHSDRVKLTDFGLARGVEDVRLTRTGFVAGTPLYMAPEQAHGENVDPRADLFSLGSVLYEAATGKHPFEGKTPLAVLRRVADETQPPLHSVDPSTPPWLSDVIDRLLAKDPADRFQTAAEVAEIFSLELARSGIEMPGCGKASAYALPRKPICWKSTASRIIPGLVGLALGALIVGLWPADEKPDSPTGAGTAPVAESGPEPKYTIPGNAGPIWAVGFTPDNALLVYGTEDGSIQLWDVKEQKIYRTLRRSGGHIWNLDITSDGKYLVAPSDNLEVEIFSLEDFKPHRKFAPGASTKAAVFTPDRKWLITGDRSALVRVWDWVDQIPYELRGHQGTVHGLAVSPDSTLVASAGSDGIVNVWNLASRTAEPLEQQQLMHRGPVYAVAFSPNAERPRMASAGWDGVVRIWNPTNLVQIHPLAGHDGDVFAVSFGKDGKLLASAGADGTVRIWDVESGKQLQVLRGSGRPFHSVRFSSDGTLLAAGGRDGNVRIWEVK